MNSRSNLRSPESVQKGIIYGQRIKVQKNQISSVPLPQYCWEAPRWAQIGPEHQIVRFLPFTNPFFEFPLGSRKAVLFPFPHQSFFPSGSWPRFHLSLHEEQLGHVFGRCNNQLKMINKNTMNNWNNMEASIGLHFDFFDSNKSVFKAPDESLSDPNKYNHMQVEDAYRPPNLFSNQNTINFADISERLDKGNQNSMMGEQNLNVTCSPANIQFQADRENIFKKGLKHLASLLMQTLLKKRFSSHSQVAQQIQKHLMMNDIHGLETSKEQKNIKRRIYDALNVMLSANVLEKQFNCLQTRQHNTAKNYRIVYKLEEEKQVLNTIANRVQTKRELLASMVSKRNALLLWMEKKAKIKEKDMRKQKLYFPLIMVVSDKEEKLRVQMSKNTLAMGFKRAEIYSQTDLIEEVVKEEYLKFHLTKREEQRYEEMTYV